MCTALANGKFALLSRFSDLHVAKKFTLRPGDLFRVLAIYSVSVWNREKPVNLFERGGKSEPFVSVAHGCQHGVYFCKFPSQKASSSASEILPPHRRRPLSEERAFAWTDLKKSSRLTLESL